MDLKKILEGASANLRGANLRGANLREAYLREAYLGGAYLGWADLRGADLRGAYLREANLREANLREANLREANLGWAYLRGADLRGANLREANLPAPTMVLLAKWGVVSDELCVLLMRLDASAHPDPSAFMRWVEDADKCPYNDAPIQRVAIFKEKAELWSPGPPPTIWEAMDALLKEKCKGWG